MDRAIASTTGGSRGPQELDLAHTLARWKVAPGLVRGVPDAAFGRCDLRSVQGCPRLRRQVRLASLQRVRSTDLVPARRDRWLRTGALRALGIGSTRLSRGRPR